MSDSLSPVICDTGKLPLMTYCMLSATHEMSGSPNVALHRGKAVGENKKVAVCAALCTLASIPDG
jgi:hypothetical protein